MSQTPEWAARHAEQMRDHWWWRPGWDAGTRFYTWHLTFDNQLYLHGLVAAYQRQVAHVPNLDLVPQQWLHLTMQGVGFTHDVDQVDLERIVMAVENRLATQPTSAVTLHRPLVRPEAVALLPWPVEPVTAVRTAIREARAEALPALLCPKDTFNPTSAWPTATASTPPQTSFTRSTR